MQERLKQIPAKLLEIWKKYTKKQKVIILSSIGTVLCLFLILIFVLGRTEYVTLTTFDDVTTTKAAVDILKDNHIAYEIQSDNKTVLVDTNKKTEAVMLLSDSSIQNPGLFGIDELLNNDMSTTNYDKQVKLHLYYQSEIKRQLEKQEGIDEAEICYLPTDTRTSILETEKEIGVTVFLKINDKFKSSLAEGTAIAVANSIGNGTTDKVKVIDQYGNLLYNGSQDSETVNANKNLEFEKAAYADLEDRVTRFALMNGFSFAESSFNLDINYDQRTEKIREYYANEGMEQGLYSTYNKINSENKGANGDVAGTDSNDDVDYMLQTSGSGNSSYEEINITYAPNEKSVETYHTWPIINKENSSVGIALKKVKQVKEEDLKSLGLLEDVSFEEYAAKNSEPVAIAFEDEWYKFFSDVTGIDQDKISITMYEVSNFIPEEKSATNWAFYLQILLFILILGLLVFIVFRGLKPVEVSEVEPELSVEQLLATTKENQSLDDIEFSEKSETKRMIEKFVDENPEAVANLLRNWLQDELN